MTPGGREGAADDSETNTTGGGITSRRAYLAAGASTATVGLTGCLEQIGIGGGGGDEINVGAAVSSSGRFSGSGSYVKEAYELWAQQVNDDGGIDGREVNLTIQDDQSQPETGVKIANRLIEQEDVEFFLGPYSSPITKAMMPVMEQNEVPMLGTIASDPTIFTEDIEWTFQAFTSARKDHQKAVEVAAEQGVESAAVLYATVSFAEASNEGAREFLDEAGIEAQSWSSEYGTEDVSTQMTEIADYDPDLLLASVYGPTVFATVRECINRNFNPEGLSSLIVTSDEFRDTFEDRANGVMGRTPWSPALEGDVHERFNEQYKENFDRTPEYHAALGYAAGQAYEQAVEEKGTSDPAEVRDYFASETPQTIAGTFEVDDRNRQIGYHHRLMQWQEGERQVIRPEDEATTDSVIWPKPEW